MKRIFGIFLACLLVIWLVGDARAQDRKVRIIVYGDSLTSGYRLQPEEAFPARLDRKLREVGFSDFEVVNMSVAGETTAGGLDRLNGLVTKQPDIVLLALGSNDVMRGIQTNLIENNLAQIIEKLKQLNVYIVFVGAKAPPSLGSVYAVQVDEVFRKTATHYRIPYYPFALEGVFGQQNLNLADGLHPNAKGVDVMVSRIYPLIDTGLRWKIKALQYEHDYQQYQLKQSMTAPR